MAKIFSRWLDFREGEGRIVVQAFLTLFLIIAGHTTLETARDALFLSKLPPSQLNIVYVVLAAVTFFVSAAATRFAGIFGRRNALICSLVVAAYLTILFHTFAPTRNAAFVIYVFSGLVGAVLLPQFWLLAAKLFTVAQGRRLFGPIASGGVLGGVAGATAAAALLHAFPVTALLPMAAAFFVATAVVLTTIVSEDSSLPDSVAPTAGVVVPPPTSWGALFRENPFLGRIATLVAISTAALLVVDYLFKATAARAMPAADLGSFFARYYAAVNVLSLVVQLVLASRLIRRIGVIPSVAVMPFLLLGSGVGVFLGGGAMVLVLVMKSIDGGLRYSLNRVATELLYLPLPGEVRERGKTLVDGVLSRVAQAAAAAVLLFLAMRGLATPHVLAAIILVLAAAWLAVTISLRSSYLDLFRKSLSTDPHVATATELGLDAAGVLVEALASPEEAKVIAAMDILSENGRGKLIPALVLYHDSPRVLAHALSLFGDAKREDWVPLAERLFAHEDEQVRVAAVRALAKHGKIDALEKAAEDPSSLVQSYAAFHLALQTSEGDLLDHPLLRVIIDMPGEFGRQSRMGLLTAISDAPDARATMLILALAKHERASGEDEAIVEQVAQAIAKIKDPRFIPRCVQRLSRRVGREAIRDALVPFGDLALDELARVLEDKSSPRRLRAQIPQTIARFRTQRASELLVDELAREQDGLVRYKLLRGLGQLVATSNVKVPRARIERETRRNLEDHLRSLALRTALLAGAGERTIAASASGRLLVSLLDDKLAQALSRAFRLLKIAYKEEDIHRVYTAALSRDKRARANAGEFLDALLSRPDQRSLRTLLRLSLEDSPPARRLEEAAEFIGPQPKTSDAALLLLVEDHDAAIAALAAHHASSLGRPELEVEIARAKKSRPMVEALGERLFGDASGPLEVQGA